MADTAAAQAPAPALEAPAAPPVDRGPGRAERRAAAIAKMQLNGKAAATAPQAAPVEKPAEAKPLETPKQAEPEKPDAATERGLKQIEQARKKFLDEQAAHKAELEVQRAEVARLRKEAEGKVTSKEELRKLSPTELLEALEHFGEDDFDILSRSAYARTKAGKTDPRAQAAAQEAARTQGSRSKEAQLEAHIKTLEEKIEKLGGEFTRRDQASFAERWVGEAVKAIPVDKPTFLSKLYANEPDTARRELLAIGAELEKANDGEAPTQAEVIEEFEKRERARLKSRGIDADALLAPPKPAPAEPKTATRTLNPSMANVTRPETAPKTREERRALAIANLRAASRASTD